MASDAAPVTASHTSGTPLLMTVGIPTFNRPAELERAARTALAQDYESLEVLISDNGSSDPEVRRVGERRARS